MGTFRLPATLREGLAAAQLAGGMLGSERCLSLPKAIQLAGTELRWVSHPRGF